MDSRGRIAMNTKVLLVALAASAALVSPAVSQGFGGSGGGGGYGIGKGGIGEITDAQTVMKREKAKEVDQEYQATMKKIPDQKVSNDPWGSVRQTGKPAKPGR
jgi:hypothetical protein